MSAIPSPRTTQTVRSRWPHRFAVATLVAAVPLVAFGGTVTSLDAGMAIDGWLVLEPGRGDHFLLTYPIEKWFRDAGTFVEHTHRLFGTLVGLLAIATLAATLATRPRAGARIVSASALLAVSAQGALGGFRVLEQSPQLAFLHGAFGQAVFALLAAQALFLSGVWDRARGSVCKHAPRLRRLALWAPAAVYAASFLGARLRHGGSSGELWMHGTSVLAATALLLALCAELRAAAADDASERSPLQRVRAKLLALLGIQLLLGLTSFWIVFFAVGPTVREVHQSFVPTLHVLCGACLLAESVAAAMWAHRLVLLRRSNAVGAACASPGGAA